MKFSQPFVQVSAPIAVAGVTLAIEGGSGVTLATEGGSCDETISVVDAATQTRAHRGRGERSGIVCGIVGGTRCDAYDCLQKTKGRESRNASVDPEMAEAMSAKRRRVEGSDDTASSSTSTARCNTESDALAAWLTSHGGGLDDRVTMCDGDGYGFHLRAKEDIPAGVALFTVPRRCMITAEVGGGAGGEICGAVPCHSSE